MQIINQNADESSLIEFDSTFCKVHQSACSPIKNQSIGSSRGGKNTKIRDYIEKEGGKVCIPDKRNFKIRHDFDTELYKKRSIIEKFFQRLKNYRHIATRYDKLAECLLLRLPFTCNLPTAPRACLQYILANKLWKKSK